MCRGISVLCSLFLCSVFHWSWALHYFPSNSLDFFFFLTISYAYFSKYCESLPFCVRCCDRHVEKGNPCARILASYENQLNITLAYTALTMSLCAQGEFAWEYRLIWTWCKEETPGRAGGAAGSSVCGLKLPVVRCKDRLVRACQIVLLGLRC